jgi:hypothetical protein
MLTTVAGPQEALLPRWNRLPCKRRCNWPRYFIKSCCAQLASYNRSANARLYEPALALDDVVSQRNVGTFFKSLHGTLNNLLLTDRRWMRRLSGEGKHPNLLDAISH